MCSPRSMRSCAARASASGKTESTTTGARPDRDQLVGAREVRGACPSSSPGSRAASTRRGGARPSGSGPSWRRRPPRVRPARRPPARSARSASPTCSTTTSAPWPPVASLTRAATSSVGVVDRGGSRRAPPPSPACRRSTTSRSRARRAPWRATAPPSRSRCRLPTRAPTRPRGARRASRACGRRSRRRAETRLLARTRGDSGRGCTFCGGHGDQLGVRSVGVLADHGDAAVAVLEPGVDDDAVAARRSPATPSPSPATIPAPSAPRMRGFGTDGRPCRTQTSSRLSEAARSEISTSPAAGAGIGRVLVAQHLGAAVLVDADRLHRAAIVPAARGTIRAMRAATLERVGAGARSGRRRSRPRSAPTTTPSGTSASGASAGCSRTCASRWPGPRSRAIRRRLLEGARTVVSAALCYYADAPEPAAGRGTAAAVRLAGRLRGAAREARRARAPPRRPTTACSWTRTSTSTARPPRAPASASTARTRS